MIHANMGGGGGVWQVTKTLDMVQAKLLLGKLTIYRNISEYERNGVLKENRNDSAEIVMVGSPLSVA